MTRELDFPVFDGDNHLYETRDALTAYLPADLDEFDGLTDDQKARVMGGILAKLMKVDA